METVQRNWYHLLIQMDLADTQNVAKYNDKYILCSIDVFSLYATCIPLRNKDSPAVSHVITSGIKSLTMTILYFQMHLPTVFHNQQTKRVF